MVTYKYNKHGMKKYIFPILVVLLFIVAIEMGVLSHLPRKNFSGSVVPPTSVSLREYVQKIIAECSQEGYRPACYDKEIPKLMDFLSMEDAFKVTWLIQEQDRSYQYCHILGHNLSAREIQKDPSRWKDVVSRCPSGMCSNGCIHGGFQERFRAERFSDAQLLAVKPDLTDLCEERGNWHPTGLEQASCYHALGHLTMYLTGADLRKSIALCEAVARKSDGRDFTQLCFDGVFMQIFQPLEPEDFALVKGKQPVKEQIPAYCGAFESKKKASCLSESWPLFWEEIKKPEGLVKFCFMTEAKERSRCFSALFYVLTAQFNFDLEKIADYCTGLPSEIRGQCFANAASRMIETDYRNIEQSTRLCVIALPLDPEQKCFQELVQYASYNFHAGSKEFLHLCNGLPDHWKTKCFAGEKGRRTQDGSAKPVVDL